MEHYVRKYSSPSDHKFPRHEGVGPSEKASLGGQTGDHKFPRHEGVGPSEKASLGGQTGGSANKKKKSILKMQIQFDMCFP